MAAGGGKLRVKGNLAFSNSMIGRKFPSASKSLSLRGRQPSQPRKCSSNHQSRLSALDEPAAHFESPGSLDAPDASSGAEPTIAEFSAHSAQPVLPPQSTEGLRPSGAEGRRKWRLLAILVRCRRRESAIQGYCGVYACDVGCPKWLMSKEKRARRVLPRPLP